MVKDAGQPWFKEAKYGLFIHWGLYSILAGEYKGQVCSDVSEWIMNTMDIPVEEYEKLALHFNPQRFDADRLVRQAVAWGMRYLVFTAKHHDGFAMFHSSYSAFNVVDATPFGRDVVKELQLACQKHGLKFCLYYSQAQDWHHPDGLSAGKDESGKVFRRYLDEKCIPQLRELLTNYGDIGLIWFDTPLSMTTEESRELYDLVKSIQPDCIVSGRIGNNIGEYITTRDNDIPLLPYHGDWEMPATINDTWGYNRHDTNWKKPGDVIRLLLKVNSRGGNYLLNLGPDEKGDIPEASMKVLDAVGAFIKDNAQAIYGTKSLAFYPYDLEWCVFTRKAYRLYIHVLSSRRHYRVNNLGNRVVRAYLPGTGETVNFCPCETCEEDHAWEFFPPESARPIFTICVELAEENPIFEPLPYLE